PIKGEELFRRIVELLNDKKTVTLDFNGITNVTTAFLNRAIGNLYNEFDSETLKRKVHYEGLDELDRHLLERVITHALLTEEQKSNLNKSIEEAMFDEQGD